MSTNKQDGNHLTYMIPVLKDVKEYKIFRVILKTYMSVMGFKKDKLQRSFEYHKESRSPDQYPYGTQVTSLKRNKHKSTTLPSKHSKKLGIR